MKKLTFLFILTFIVSGCAMEPPQEYYKPGATDDECNKVWYTCLQESQQPVSRTIKEISDSYMQTNTKLLDACLNANGFYLRTKSSD